MRTRLIVLIPLLLAAACGSRAATPSAQSTSPLPSSSASPTASPAASSPAPASSPTGFSLSPSPRPTGSVAPTARLHERGIDEFRLLDANRSVIELNVDTTNRGCSPEDFAHFNWERNQDRIAVRAYYRDREGYGTCALFTETNKLRIEGLGAGTFTLFAPMPGYGAKGQVQIIVEVE